MRRATSCAKFAAAAILLGIALAADPLMAQDADQDGLSDALEKRLGSDPNFAEELEVINDDPLAGTVPDLPARYDIMTVRMANVAKGRWLWAIEFAEPYEYENAWLLLYLDTDNDSETGRVQHGNDVYLVCGEQGILGIAYAPDGTRASGPGARAAMENGVLYLCVDMEINQVNGRSWFQMSMLSETSNKTMDRLTSTLVVGPGDSERPLTRDTGTVRGSVADVYDKPVAGARIRAILIPEKGTVDPFSPALDLQTDADGSFEAELAPGRYWVLVTKQHLAPGRTAYGDRYWDVAAGVTSDELQITLRQGGRANGEVVRGTDGTPVPGARILVDGGQTAVADGEGRFTVEGVSEGEHTLMAVAEGLAGETDGVFVKPGEDVGVTVTLEPCYNVRGIVTDEQGKPVAGAQVQIERPYDRGIFRFTGLAYTDENGVFALRHLTSAEQPETLLVRHCDFAVQSAPLPGPPAEGDTAALWIVLNRGYGIDGQVLTTEGRPVAGALVSRGGRAGFDAAGAVKTDQRGLFHMDKLTSDEEVVLQVEARGYAAAAKRVKPGREEPLPHVSFQLEPGHAARGRVVDAEGNPVVAAAIQAYMPGPDGGPAVAVGHFLRTGANGDFYYPGLPAEGATLGVYAGRQGAGQRFPLKTDEDNLIVLQE